MGSSAFEPLFFGSGGSMFSMARVVFIHRQHEEADDSMRNVETNIGVSD
jgi:hypothetical protein